MKIISYRQISMEFKLRTIKYLSGYCGRTTIKVIVSFFYTASLSLDLDT